MAKIRTLIVDDSALARNMLRSILERDPEIEVVGSAADPLIAREKIKELEPDVLTLDVEMPRMDGITFLEKLMRLRPMPVVMVSSITTQGADVTLQALELGAIDFVAKPKLNLSKGLEDEARDIIEKVKVASGARPRRRVKEGRVGVPAGRRPCPDAVRACAGRRSGAGTEGLIAIGASTGGTEAVKEILMGMPADSPGIVVAQHIPGAFSRAWSRRMDASCALRIAEAEEGCEIRPGHVYIAPGSHHLLVGRSGSRMVCRLSEGPAVNRHRPSVDVLFRSVAVNVGSNAVGVILTGMGDDGARGLKEMKEAGATTVAQDEKTSVVWGMPAVAVKLDAVSGVLPLGRIAGKLISLFETSRRETSWS